MDKLEQLIKNYQVPKKALEILEQTKVVLLVGISGAGKNTILNELLKSPEFSLVVSHTTRAPRKNEGKQEVDGQDYYFIEEREAIDMLEQKKFVEAKFYSGNVYGTSFAEFNKAYVSRKTAITDIEVQGVEEYIKITKNVIPVFILPPSYEIWQERLANRYKGTNIDNQDLKLRRETSAKELAQALQKNYYQFIVNDDLRRVTEAIKKIVAGENSDTKNAEAILVAKELLGKLND